MVATELVSRVQKSLLGTEFREGTHQDGDISITITRVREDGGVFLEFHFVSSEPLEGIRVTFVELRFNHVYVGIISSAGTFRIRRPAAGEYTIEVT